ncbi:asparagine synthase (glutamine-hydrolyzing) [Xenorhabdus sp. SGI240]|uniref:asparagine synthase (glutamine-hydrolyzing) n=1 Tax=Xenorhabdus sp. SGI240 TaxID=3158262 RepID=UPI0032B86DDE
MCGISGWLDWKANFQEEQYVPILESMNNTMFSRGPDEGGIYRGIYIALTHRRLSVIDLQGGKQPMVSYDNNGNTSIVSYNGEIYNFKELRDELISLGYKFDTFSDTEVVVKAYQQWGVHSAERFRGIFAYAIWDSKLEKLVLVRDRLGVKPLYYHIYNNGILFCSEPKGILEHPLYKTEVGEEGLIELLALSSAPSPGKVVYKDINQVKPGFYITVTNNNISEYKYWSLQPEEDIYSYEYSCQKIRNELESIVAQQLVSDVNIGSLLSGGLDSSVISAIAANYIKKDMNEILNTYSIDFNEHEKFFTKTLWHTSRDEPFAREVSEYIGSKHRTTLLTYDEQLNNELISLKARDFPGWGEMDVSLYLLFKNISKYTTVVLSGEGADEIFSGYPFLYNTELHKSETFPWLEGKTLFSSLLRSDLIKQERIKEYISESYNKSLSEITFLHGESESDIKSRKVSYLTLTRWLPALLERNDRMSMAAGIEVRVPFCDHRLIEMLYNISYKKKYNSNIEKKLLRDISIDLLPQSILKRRKSAFPAQIDPRYSDLLQIRIKNLLEDSSALIWDIIDANKVKEYLSTNKTIPSPRAAASATNGLGFLLNIDAWLNIYNPKFNI